MILGIYLYGTITLRDSCGMTWVYHVGMPCILRTEIGTVDIVVRIP